MTLFDSTEIYASEVEEIHTYEFFGLKEKFFRQWSSVVEQLTHRNSTSDLLKLFQGQTISRHSFKESYK